MVLRIAILQSFVISERVDVVNDNVPFLAGLDLLDKFGVYVNNVKNMLCCLKFIIKIPLQKKWSYLSSLG